MKWKDSTTANLQQIRSGTADGNELAQVRPAFYSAQLNFIVLFPQHLSQITTFSPQWVMGFFFPRVYSGRVVAVTTNPHVAPRLKKMYSYTSTPTLGLRSLCLGWTLPLHILPYSIVTIFWGQLSLLFVNAKEQRVTWHTQTKHKPFWSHAFTRQANV
jgi:hypothetical protein